MEKDSFIMRKKYQVQLKKLSTTQKAQRVDAVFERQTTWQVMENLDPLVDMLLSLMIQEWWKDNQYYEQVCEQNRINWRKWWAKIWNQNARKNWEKQPKQPNGWKNNRNNPKQPKQADSDNDSDSDNYVCIAPSAEERENKLRQTSATIKAERLWNIILNKWNQKLEKSELRNNELTRLCYSLDWTNLDLIETYIERYRRIRDNVNEKHLQELFYYDLNKRTLKDFLKNLNMFEGKFEEIIPRFAKNDSWDIALRKLKS